MKLFLGYSLLWAKVECLLNGCFYLRLVHNNIVVLILVLLNGIEVDVNQAYVVRNVVTVSFLQGTPKTFIVPNS